MLSDSFANPVEDRLALYRQVLLRNVAKRRDNGSDQPKFDADQLANAFAAALGRFATANGELRVAEANSYRPYGGG